MKMRYALGIDGGGTKTCAVIVDDHGNVCGAGRSGSANYDDVGPDVVREHLAEAVTAARAAAGLGAAPFATVFLGLAGVVSERDRATIRRLAEPLALAPAECIGIDHDCRIALAGGLAGAPGIVLIAGTGSSCYGRNARGASWRAGGWGQLISDEGSGYWFGVRALQCAVRAYDGRGEETVLLPRLRRHLGLPEMNDLLHRLYVDGLSRAELAALGPLVLRAAQEGDKVALGLVDEGTALLADCVAAVAYKLDMHEEACPVVSVGGLFRAGETLLEPLRRAIQRRVSNAGLHAPRLPPSLGAALIALQQLDVPVTEEMVQRLEAGTDAIAG